MNKLVGAGVQMMLCAALTACAATGNRDELTQRIEVGTHRIYLGSESELPVGGDFVMAMNLTPDEIRKLTSDSLDEAARRLLTTLPDWYVEKMAASSRESECVISRDGVELSEELQMALIHVLAPHLDSTKFNSVLINEYGVSGWRNEIINCLYIAACGYASGGKEGMDSYLRFVYQGE